ncbi:MAG: signal recognition particle-docking protein FtsY [Bdellovibrionales bacterium]|nr:signal recognition particle-docking protein FtsY [Bdellovibrionales bacterium]
METITDLALAVSRWFAEVGFDPILLLVPAVFLVTLLAILELRRHRRYTAELEAQLAALLSSSASGTAHVSSISPPSSRSTIEERLPTPTVAVDESPSTSVHGGLSKTRKHFFSRLREVFGGRRTLGEAEYAALEELLISSDMGVKTSHALLEKLQAVAREEGELDESTVRARLKGLILEILSASGASEIHPSRQNGEPFVLLVVGVNGVGKTTTIGKLASKFKAEGHRVLLGACDTFRAAAVEQLQAWGRRTDIDVHAGPEGAKPATVAYEALARARSENYDVLIVDTAGRLHTRVNLMNELENVIRILARELPGSPHETLLVLDASTGQNALQQAREFHQRAALTGIVMTKLDGTPKGGITVAVRDELSIPIRYIGVGEGVDDLKPFSAQEFVDALFAEDGEQDSTPEGSEGEQRPVARRRRERAF